MAEEQAHGSAHTAKDEAVASGAQAGDPVDRASAPRITIAQGFARVRNETDFWGAQEAVLAILERLLLTDDERAPPHDPLPDNAMAPVRSSPVTQAQDQPTVAASLEISENTTNLATTRPVDLSGSAAAAAKEVDLLCPSTTSEPQDAEYDRYHGLEAYLTSVWWMILSAANAVPYDHKGQDQLVAVVENLSLRARATITVWGSECRLWKDLPLFSAYLREDWVDPVYAIEPDDFGLVDVDAGAATRWVNLNAFTARLMNKGVYACPVYAIESIRNGLEEKHPPTGGTREYTLRVASQWILLCGIPLFKIAFRGDDFDELGLTITVPGQLYIDNGGKAGLCMHRWRFWMKRFEELGSGGAEEDVRYEARQAAQLMHELIEQDGRAIACRLGLDEDNQLAGVPQIKNDEQGELVEQDEFYDAFTQLDPDVILGPPVRHGNWWLDPINVVPLVVGSTFVLTVAAAVSLS